LEEGLIDKTTAVSRVEPAQLDQLLHPMVDPKASVDLLSTGTAGLTAVPAYGQVVFDPDLGGGDGEGW
jgi:pyruvate,orthophosphate dikinase